MFQINWSQSALDDLGSAWLAASSTLREAITRASHDAEEQIQAGPEDCGESRPGGIRLLHVRPLTLYFLIEPDGSTIRILNVHVIRLRNA